MDETWIPLRDGARLWATVSGHGPAVILCHGGPGLWDYLAPLAALFEDRRTVIRFEQRGCGRSTGGGPFTIAQAVDDLDQVRAAVGADRCAVLGHSWGAELALRHAARHPDRVEAVGYLAGVGADDAFRPAYVAERARRLGADLGRWQALGARSRNPAEEHEWCVLQWRADFSPASARQHAEALWRTRPPDVTVNAVAHRELWDDRATEDLVVVARSVTCPVLMLFGADDPRPWTAADPMRAALPDVRHLVLPGAGHSPWVEQPDATRQALLELLTG